MGLNLHPGDAQWSYSGFNRFRERVALHFGIELLKMQGFFPHRISAAEAVEWNKKAVLWSTVKNPIKYLLNHSDCQGKIGPSRCALIIPELKKALKAWPDDDHDYQNGLLLVKGMQECVRKNKPLIFS